MDYKEYLNSLGSEEREYVAKFFKRKEYIETLNETAINNCKEVINSGRGNCNSKITVIADNHNDLDTIIKFIKPMFESINTSLWNIYITSIIKADSNNIQMWEQMIQHEMNAVSPSFIFEFGTKQSSFTEYNMNVFNKTFPVVYINMDDVNYVLDKNNFKTEKYVQIMNDLYKYILQIIQYREIEIAE